MENEAELEKLILQWRGRLFAAAYAELPGRYADAQDAVAQALVRIVKRAHQLRQPERFGAWACQIARREARRIAAKERGDALPETLAASLEDTTLRLDIEAALRRLPAALALTLGLHYQQGLSVVELASALSVPEGTIKWRLSRGREHLRQGLKGYEPMKTHRCALIASELEPTLTQALTDILLRVGFRSVQLVRTFHEALDLETDGFSALVLDEKLTGHSAFELIPLLRQNTACPLWLLFDRESRTEEELKAVATAAYIAGVDYLLSKPFEHAEFQRFAQRLFERLSGP